VLVVVDQAVFADALRLFLRRDARIEVVGIARAAEAMRRLLTSAVHKHPLSIRLVTAPRGRARLVASPEGGS
jgi:hypothetical protein